MGSFLIQVTLFVFEDKWESTDLSSVNFSGSSRRRWGWVQHDMFLQRNNLQSSFVLHGLVCQMLKFKNTFSAAFSTRVLGARSKQDYLRTSYHIIHRVPDAA